jgi:hypothetical protein
VPFAPNRRWSYSLRTLFVVLMVFGVWLGLEARWIRHRHELLSKHEPRVARLAFDWDKPPKGSTCGMVCALADDGLSLPDSIVLSLFGESLKNDVYLVLSQDEVTHFDEATQTNVIDIERAEDYAQSVFPEAIIHWVLD